MPTRLFAFLASSGIVTFFVLKWPFIVIMGLFLAIIPGLILMAIPNLFLWGCLFTIGYLPGLLLFRSRWVAIPALLLAAVTLYQLPQPSREKSSAMLARMTLDNVTPKGAVPLRGDIRIDTNFENWDDLNSKKYSFRPYVCDARCMDLLFVPGVRSVTVTSTRAYSFEDIRDGVSRLAPYAVTYRLRPKARCGKDGLDVSDKLDTIAFANSNDDRRALAAERGLKFESEVCLVGEKPLETYDMLLRSGHWRHGDIPRYGKNDWSLLPDRANASYAEIRAGGSLLFRRFDLQVDVLVVPLSIGIQGSYSDAASGWARTVLRNSKPNEIKKPSDEINDWLDVRRTAPALEGMAAARKALQLALESRDFDEKRLASLTARYLDVLEGKTPNSEDVDIIASLVLDDRLHDIERAWVIPRTLKDESLLLLLPKIINKLSALPDEARVDSNLLGSSLREWPEQTFAHPDPATIALLGDPLLRMRATGLIERLSDRGDAGAAMASEITVWHVVESETIRRDPARMERNVRNGVYEGNLRAIRAGMTALCQLGPRARAQLPALLAVEHKLDDNQINRQNWDRMMARIGKPVDQITKPPRIDGSDAGYRRNLSFWLARFGKRERCPII